MNQEDVEAVASVIRRNMPADYICAAAAIQAMMDRGWGKQQWLPIETAPKDGSKILISGGYSSPAVTIGRWAKDMKSPHWRDDKLGRYPITPLHWMPLPTPPTTEHEGD